jgi:CRP-like cAMP-binding protein
VRILEAKVVLSRRGWLPATSAGFRAAVLDGCGLRRFAAGQTIYSRGDPPGGLWGLAAGQIAIEAPSADLGSYIAYFAGPGYWIGAAPTITRDPRHVGIVAARPSVLLHLPIAEFEAIAAKDPEAWRWLAVLPIQQSLLATGVATDLMIRDPRCRLVAILLRLAGCREPLAAYPPEPEEILISQEALAVIVNLSRTALGEMLRSLEREGRIARRYRRIQLDRERCLELL